MYHAYVPDLDEEQKAYVVEAMLEKVVQPGEVIIRCVSRNVTTLVSC